MSRSCSARPGRPRKHAPRPEPAPCGVPRPGRESAAPGLGTSPLAVRSLPSAAPKASCSSSITPSPARPARKSSPCWPPWPARPPTAHAAKIPRSARVRGLIGGGRQHHPFGKKFNHSERVVVLPPEPVRKEPWHSRCGRPALSSPRTASPSRRARGPAPSIISAVDFATSMIAFCARPNASRPIPVARPPRADAGPVPATGTASTSNRWRGSLTA